MAQRILYICLLVMLANQNVAAQSAAFSLMLRGLLSHSVPEISPKQAISISNVVFLDCRTSDEAAISMLPQAHYVGYDDFALHRLKNISKTSPIVTYCTVGYRSEKIAEKLRAAGYTNVHNLVGGIIEWKNQGYTTQTAAGVTTDRVHTHSKSWSIWLKKGVAVWTNTH
jgi:rhodanese-related sulfurtransferase